MYEEHLHKAFYGLCYRVNTPVSLGLWFRFCYAPSELAEASIDPMAYSDPVRFFGDYACLNLLRKYEGLKTGIDTKERAILKFRQSEEKCREYNDTLRTVAITGRLARTEHSILRRAQELVASVWGNPSFSQLFDHCGWGPGATSTLKGRGAQVESKMSQFPVSISPAAIPYFRQVIKHDYAWLRHLLKQDVCGPTTLLPECFELVSSSRLLTVPKDAKTDRTIAAEPTGNTYLQKGIGKYLRLRLKRYGVDLDDQSINQSLAARAVFEKLATLDLRAASDTISIGVVRLLCPPDMFELLNRLRSPSYGFEGCETRFHKFSSMGNGFTFELESLLFWAAAKAASEHVGSQGPVGVYGDDIIVTQSTSGVLITFLEDLGFEVNLEKSFTEGLFFESCGKHYFRGVDVTPVFQKQRVDNDLELLRLANRIFELFHNRDIELDDYKRKWGLIHHRLVASFPDRLAKLSAPPWVQGDGFYRVQNWQGRFQPGRGIKIRYASPKRPRSFLGDGGLFAYSLKQSDGSHRDLHLSTRTLVEFAKTLVESKFLGEDTRTFGLSTRTLVEFAKTLSEFEFLDMDTHGLISPRPQGRVKKYKIKQRWVSLPFGLDCIRG